MAIKQKRSLTPGSIPTTSSLQAGELAINVPDGKLFLRKSGSGSDTIQSAITTGAQNSGSVVLSGSLSIYNPTGTALEISGDIFEISGDLIEFTGSFKITGSAIVTGSLSVTNGITGSLQGTSSWAVSASQATTSSYILQAVSASFASTAASATTASYVLNAVSSSFASTASSADNFTVRNTLTAQTIVVQTITSSVDFVTGSTRFGSLISNTHIFTGSVSITGSLTAVGAISASSFTGSLLGTATTASFVTTAQTASYVLQAVSASFATTAASATTASYILQAVSASFATSASNADLLDGAHLSILATTGSNTFRGNQTITGSLNITGSLTVVGAVSASNFTGSLLGTASFATSASWAPGGGASFPYTGSAVITGSLVVTGSFDLGIAEFNSTSSATTAGTTVVSSYATASANSAFYNYYISSGSNARAGQIMSVWSGSTINYTEVTTNDLGNTNTASFAVTLATGNVRLSFTAPGVWTVRSIVNLL